MCYNSVGFSQRGIILDKNIHEGHRKRLRSKFIKNKELLSQHEILELLLGYSIARKDTNPLAHELINKFGSLLNVLSADPELLKGVDGISDTTSCLFSLIDHISTLKLNQKRKTVKLNNISTVKDFVIPYYKNVDTEIFYAFFLDGNKKVLGNVRYDSDKRDGVTINFEDLSKNIVAYKPKSIIVSHNHFAKYPYPSSEDDKTTAKLFAFLAFHKVALLDHLIISNKEVYSYFYDNRLQKIKEEIKDKLL